MSAWAVRCIVVAGLVTTLACDPGVCDPAGLEAALARAASGQTVALGACRVEGAFEVPAGVIVRGVDGSVLASAAASETQDEPVVSLGPGAALEGALVESTGRAAVVLRAGAALADVQIELGGGAGALLDGDATLTRVSILGPVTAASADDERWVRVIAVPPDAAPCPSAECECEPGAVDDAADRICDLDGRWSTRAPTFGIYARGGTVTLSEVSILGIARHGLVADGVTGTWAGGAVEDVIGVGVLLRGGAWRVEDVDVARVVEGLVGLPSHSVIVTSGASLDSSRLRVVDGQRFGMLTVGASGAHDGLVVEGHGDVGVWVGESDAFSMSGGVVSDNAFAGVLLADSTNVTLDGATVENTREVRRSVFPFGVQELGDGLHVVGAYEAIVLRALTVTGNARVGVLLDLGAASPDVRFDDVRVGASGAAFGAVAGRADAARGALMTIAPGGWDAGLVREGAAIDNDAAPPAELDLSVGASPEGLTDVTSIVAPMY